MSAFDYVISLLANFGTRSHLGVVHLNAFGWIIYFVANFDTSLVDHIMEFSA